MSKLLTIHMVELGRTYAKLSDGDFSYCRQLKPKGKLIYEFRQLLRLFFLVCMVVLIVKYAKLVKLLFCIPFIVHFGLAMPAFYINVSAMISSFNLVIILADPRSFFLLS